MRVRTAALGVAGASLAVGAAVAWAGGGSGSIAAASFFSTTTPISTPSSAFQTVDTRVVPVNAGPVLIRFSGFGFEQDWDSSPKFVGKSYAAMKARVLVNGVRKPPTVTLIDNAGEIGVKTPQPRTGSYGWAFTSGATTLTIKVQIANAHTFDMAQLTSYTITVLHA